MIDTSLDTTAWCKALIAAVEPYYSEHGRAGLHEPWINGNEWQYVKECLDTAWVSTAGKYVDTFGEELAKFTGAKHAVPVVNGTAALHAALLVSGVEENHEVLSPTLTFVATTNAISYTGAIPHFVDSAENHPNIDAKKLANYLENNTHQYQQQCINSVTGRVISALMVVHIFGDACDMAALTTICKQHNLKLIEDAAEGLGTYFGDRHVGNFGTVSALSFNGNKIMTTGGGGAVLTNDDEIATKLRHITTTAKMAHPWEYFHDEVGYNYRMPNLNAALGCAQLEQMPNVLTRKKALHQRYLAETAPLSGGQILQASAGTTSNHWLNTVLLDKGSDKNRALEALNAVNIQSRPVWQLMHTLPMFNHTPCMDLSCAENLAERLINIPSSAFL